MNKLINIFYISPSNIFYTYALNCQKIYCQNSQIILNALGLTISLLVYNPSYLLICWARHFASALNSRYSRPGKWLPSFVLVLVIMSSKSYDQLLLWTPPLSRYLPLFPLQQSMTPSSIPPVRRNPRYTDGGSQDIQYGLAAARNKILGTTQNWYISPCSF